MRAHILLFSFPLPFPLSLSSSLPPSIPPSSLPRLALPRPSPSCTAPRSAGPSLARSLALALTLSEAVCLLLLLSRDLVPPHLFQTIPSSLLLSPHDGFSPLRVPGEMQTSFALFLARISLSLSLLRCLAPHGFRTNASFIQEGRLRIEAVDARDLHLAQLLRRLHVEQGGAADSPLRAALLSNELPDAFAVEKVLVGVLPPPTQSAPSPLSRWRLQRGRVLPLIRLSELKQIMQLIAAHSGLSPPTGPSLAPWSRMPHRLQMTRYIQSEMPPPFLHRCCLPLSLTPPRLPHILRLPISQMPAISLE